MTSISLVHTLLCLGAAVVPGRIGFLGAGLKFREGLSVRGLNAAATLWCSAAVGVLAGAGSQRMLRSCPPPSSLLTCAYAL